MFADCIKINMPPCVAPTCHRTRPRKRPGLRTLPSRCARPNPWNAFRTRVSGQGLSKDELSLMYNTWKQNWSIAHPGLSRSDARAEMNATLCAEIDESNSRMAEPRRLAPLLAANRDDRRRQARERTRRNRPGRFFAKKNVPVGWSLNAHIQWIRNQGLPYFRFMHNRRYRDGRAWNEDIRTNDLERLLPGRWFNDSHMNAYMSLLSGTGNPGSTTSIFLNSMHFTTFTVAPNRDGQVNLQYVGQPPNVRHNLVQRWTRLDDTTNPQMKIFVPINAGNSHWYMIMIDTKNKKIWSMDSFGGNHEGAREEVLNWFEVEHAVKQRPFNRALWTTATKNVPKQRNGCDCGPFSCLFAAFMSNDKRMSFLQGDLPTMRNRIAWSILHSSLE